MEQIEMRGHNLGSELRCEETIKRVNWDVRQ